MTYKNALGYLSDKEKELLEEDKYVEKMKATLKRDKKTL